MSGSVYLAEDFTDKTRELARKVIAILKTEEATVAEVRDVLKYIDATIDRNAVIK